MGLNMQKTILMLGGSRQQVVAIEKARELGYRTVVCDYLPDNPGQHHADAFYLVSTTDREAVLKVAQQENVDGVLAYASDPAAPSAAYVAERLALPTNPLRSIEVLSEKHLFRKHLAEIGLACPHAVTVTRDCSYAAALEEATSLHLPLVVKPTDSSGSKGVRIIASLGELEDSIAYARQFSRNDVIIIEEYIERVFPHVIGGDIFILDGKIEFLGLMRCLRDESSPLVPVGKMLPAGLTRVQVEKIREAIQILVTSLDVRFGEMNVEIILGKDNTPYLLELGARAGGNMIPIQLSDASGIDLVAANVQTAMGEWEASVTWDSSQTACPYVTYVLHAREAGRFDGVELSDSLREALYREVLYVDPGAQMQAMSGADKALGILFFKFDDEDHMARCCRAIHNSICVRAM